MYIYLACTDRRNNNISDINDIMSDICSNQFQILDIPAKLFLREILNQEPGF